MDRVFGRQADCGLVELGWFPTPVPSRVWLLGTPVIPDQATPSEGASPGCPRATRPRSEGSACTDASFHGHRQRVLSHHDMSHQRGPSPSEIGSLFPPKVTPQALPTILSAHASGVGRGVQTA